MGFGRKPLRRSTIDGRLTGGRAGLGLFARRLAEDWRGWQGQRVRDSLENEMTVEATHDGRGHVAMAVTVRGHRQAFADGVWAARVAFALEAGEQMSAAAHDIRHLLGSTLDPGQPTPRQIRPRDRGTTGHERTRSARPSA
jgi:hypothetical protein